MSKFAPSKYQKDIFNFIKDDKRNAVISAVAGSGKTTTLIKALELMPSDKTILFLAFNKSICNELIERVPKNKNIQVKTVHAFGYNTLLSSGQIEIDNNKYRKLLRDIIQFHSKNDNEVMKPYGFDKVHMNYIYNITDTIRNENIDIESFVGNTKSLCELGRLNLINLEDKTIGLEELERLSIIYSIDNEDGEAEVAWYLSKLGFYYRTKIDFVDMISLPNMLGLPTPVYDFVFIDECQDLNTCQRLLMQKAIKPDTGRFIAVGDPKQAIYAFAGADAEAYRKLKDIPNTIELPLSVTYRCATQIVDKVKHINPIIKALKKNKEGSILEEFSYKDVQDGDMVLCRQSFPIVSLCVKFLSEGKKAYIIGSDIGASLESMILKCQRKTEEFNMDNVFSRLYREKEKMIEKIMTNHKMSKKEANDETTIALYNEKILVIEVLSQKISDPYNVIKKIKDLFSDTKKVGICLSTIHKSKGLESERVFILHRELMPSKLAKFPWQKEQESNLEYVAYTRAKTTLGFINDYDAYKGHKSKMDVVKPVVDSRHVGIVGTKMYLELKVLDKRRVDGQYGETTIYEMMDRNGNLFTKFGNIKEDFLIKGDKVDINSTIGGFGVITNHDEYKGSKINRLGRLSLH